MEQSHPTEPLEHLRLFAGPQLTFDEISSHLPELRTLAPDLSAAISFFASGAYERYPSGAIPLVTTQAINDFIDGLWDCMAGRGRPALRASRALFESLVNLKDLIEQPELEERYLDHLYVVEAVTGAIKTHPGFLTIKERVRRAVTHRRDMKTRERRVQQIHEKYGKKFLNQWHPTDFRTRAERHGFVEEYAFYRKSSAVLHGASTGKIGLVAESDEQTHFRTGPALELCQIAYPYLLRFFQEFVDAYAPQISHLGCGELRDVLNRLGDLSREYVSVVHRIDSEAWPKHPVPGPCAVAVIRRNEGIRWYLHDIANGRIRAARLTEDLPQDQSEVLEKLMAAISRVGPADPVSVAFEGVRVEPDEASDWVKAEDVLLGNPG